MADEPAKKQRWSLKNLWRSLHRDVGHLAVGLTVVYACSGLAVNHIADWEPSFVAYQETRELGGPIAGSDEEITAVVRRRLAIAAEPRDVYRAAPDDLQILFERSTLHVNPASGHVLEEGQRPRFFLRAANWLHLNRGKKAWTYFADSYAVGLLFLATSGLFMIAGKKGFFGRGVYFVAAGVAIPLVYLALVRG